MRRTAHQLTVTELDSGQCSVLIPYQYGFKATLRYTLMGSHDDGSGLAFDVLPSLFCLFHFLSVAAIARHLRVRAQ